MKRSPLKKKSKAKISTLQNKLWELCKSLIRHKYGNICYTCGAIGLAGSDWQTGHMWAKASVGAYLKYDLRILRPQCYRCNILHGGRGADFYERMLKEIGQEAMDQLQRDRQVTVKAYDHYVKLINEYETIAEEIKRSNE